MDSYRMESPVLQKECSFEDSENVSDLINSIQQSFMKQKMQPTQDFQTNIRKRKCSSSFTSMQDLCKIQNKENISEVLMENKTATSSKDNVRKYMPEKDSEHIKKPRLMATAIDLLEKKIFQL